jgi:hypothetical protein
MATLVYIFNVGADTDARPADCRGETVQDLRKFLMLNSLTGFKKACYGGERHTEHRGPTFKGDNRHV